LLNLTANIDFRGTPPPFIVKLDSPAGAQPKNMESFFPQKISFLGNGEISCEMGDCSFTVHGFENDDLRGDVLLCYPERGNAQRLIRRNSAHNTILFTEKCDQLCVMCSQPPKNSDYSWIFPHYMNAILLADEGIRIGISGGEPTLYLDPLLEILEKVAEDRPDISFHILSNAQHISREYVERLRVIHGNLQVLWGIPLYSHKPELHDEIVGKEGAFECLLNNLFNLAASGAQIELRTVVTLLNAQDLPSLSKFIASSIPFISVWAIMAMEPIGYAKANKAQVFYDHSLFPEPILAAIDYGELRGINPKLYNFPRCTIPPGHRDFCTDSISDWKKKYLSVCNDCSEKDACCGFFEWYDDNWRWQGVATIEA
jgi:His-Xaa-Ser system radical SAM maturase HxsC